MNVSKIVFRNLFIVFCQLCISVSGFDIKNVEQLKTDLFNNTYYDISVRPIFNQSESLQVQVQLGISSILDIDYGIGKLEYTGFIHARWQDKKLIWNSTQYGGLTKLKLDMAQIWNPDIVQLDVVGESASTTLAFVDNTGMVTMVTNSELYSLCEYDDTYYECSTILFSINPSSEVNIVPLTNSVNLANFKGNGTWEWDTTSVYTIAMHIAELNDTNVEIIGLVNTIRVVSAAMSSFIHKFIPLCLITYTCIFCCLVPLNSGERISYNMTVFLALVFLQALIADELPKHSSYTSSMSIFMTLTLCQSIMSVFITAILCRLSVKDKEMPIPNWLYKLSVKSKHKPICFFVFIFNKDQAGSNRRLEITWLDAAECLDKIFFWVQMFFLFIICCIPIIR